MLQETETEETIDFVVTFLSLVVFQLEGGWLRLWLSGYRVGGFRLWVTHMPVDGHSSIALSKTYGLQLLKNYFALGKNV